LDTNRHHDEYDKESAYTTLTSYTFIMQENKKPSGTLEDISRKVATPPHLLPLAIFVTMFSRLHCLYILTYGSRAELGSQTVRCGVLRCSRASALPS